jgi:hypothetical protein
VIPVREFFEFPIDAKIVRVNGAVVLGKQRIDCTSRAYRKQNVEPIDFHFGAMLILAVSLSHVTEKAAKCALRLGAIALVMAAFLASFANVVWAFVTAAGLVAKIPARRAYRNRISFIIIIVIVNIIAIIVFIARRLLTIWIVALHSALAIIASVFHVHCDRSVTSSGILYIFVVVMLVLTSVRKIGAVTFLAAVTIATLTHMVAIIIAWAIDAHRAVVGILIVSIMDTLRNGIISQLRERFSFRILEPSVQLLCTCYTRGTGTSHTSVHDRAFCTSRSNLSSSRFRYDAF